MDGGRSEAAAARVLSRRSVVATTMKKNEKGKKATVDACTIHPRTLLLVYIHACGKALRSKSLSGVGVLTWVVLVVEPSWRRVPPHGTASTLSPCFDLYDSQQPYPISS